MSDAILVTYSTKYGSTEEVSQAVASMLRDGGFSVDVQPMNKVRSLDGYKAVVLGTALYVGRLHGDSRRFLVAQRAALAKLPVALFALGPVHSEAKEWLGAREQLAKELARFPWFTPVAQEVFGGRFDPAKLGFPFNLIPPMRKMPVSDVRDWTAIRAWASGLGQLTREPVGVV